jgi:hypothetical protein
MRASLQQRHGKAPFFGFGAFLFARNAIKLGPLNRPVGADEGNGILWASIGAN